MWSWWKWLFGGLTAAGLLVAGPRLYTAFRYTPAIQTAAEAPAQPVAIVFGAGLLRNGRPTAVLYDRVATAAELYHQGKVQYLLLSGDNSSPNYDEPAAMRLAALELGVPETALWLDGAGARTYDSCYRARAVYGVRAALLVTQAFHLPRALFICDGLGLQTTGVAADRRPYLARSMWFWNLRELFATAAAGWDLFIARPTPRLDQPPLGR